MLLKGSEVIAQRAKIYYKLYVLNCNDLQFNVSPD
jgi:hypothetical protein